VTQESSVIATGMVRADDRAPGGYELGLTDLQIVQLAEDYPITPKGARHRFPDGRRHLWLRSTQQWAVLRVRATVIAPSATGSIPWLFAGGRAHPHAGGLRGHHHAVRDRILWRKGLPHPERPALQRGHHHGLWAHLLLWPYLSRRKEQDPAAPDRVLDGRARDGLRRPGRLHAVEEEFVSYIVQRTLEERAEELKILERDTSSWR
jgi:asparaginyl-tRNA synthetase